MAANSDPTPDLTSLEKIPGFDSRPSIDPESVTALDAALAAKVKEKEKAGDPEPPKSGDPEPPKTGDPEPPKSGDPEPPKTGDPEPPKPAAKDELDEVALPPYSKPKTTESFDKVKSIAREKIAAAEKERDEARKQADEFKAKASAGLPKEIEDELKTLRNFRNKMDVEASPEFKSYDKTVADNIESIYSRLKADGFTDKQIEEIKTLGGPSEVDWDAIADKMKPTLKRFIDTKLVENESLKDKKDRAIAEAKKNADEYIRGKANESTEVKTKQTAEAKTTVEQMLPKLGWFDKRKPTDKSTEREKGIIERHNKLVEEAQEFLSNAIQDTSADFRATLAIGYVQMLKARFDIDQLKSDKDAEITTLKADLKKANDFIEKIKKASTSRLQPSIIPDTTVPSPGTDNINVPGGQALDALAKQQMASKG